MFLIIPAIDIMDGKAVRLRQGKAEDKTIYSSNPVEVAKEWEQAGARRIHLVDLDGAFAGRLKNLQTISKIRQATQCDLELGGGIRDPETVQTILKEGVNDVILGTAAVKNPDFLKRVLEHEPDRVIIGIDAKDGQVAIKGWVEVDHSLQAFELAQQMNTLGCSRIIYTDIATDGMMQGPNLERLKQMGSIPGVSLIASGGITRIEDIQAIRELEIPSIQGAIVGRALYEKTIDLAQAIREFQDNGQNCG